MFYRIVGRPLGDEVHTIHGTVKNGEIERPDTVRWLRDAHHLEVVPAPEGYPPILDGTLDPSIINWRAPLLGTADGYGNSAERMIQALEVAGHRVTIERPYTLSSGETVIDRVLRRPEADGYARIVYTQPDRFWRKRFSNQITIGFTMWEDDTLPPDWNPYLDLPDAIAMPSMFCVEVLERRLRELAIEKPVFCVPLGVAHTEYPYRARSCSPGDLFTFLWSATNVWDPRKGAREAIDAFLEAFPNAEPVRLIMRSRGGRMADVRDPRIEWREGLLTEKQKLELLYEAHAYYCTSFGEGFGLMPLEAIASGLPTIASDNSALSEYRDLFFPIGCDPEPSGILGPGSIVHTKGQWMRPRRAETVQQLRAMVADYPARTTFAAAAAHGIRLRWGYDRTAATLLDVVATVREVHA
jgi:glycosyltransferase involved in cell wall biosynthesis